MARRTDLDVLKHLGALQRYARSLTGNDSEAEDLVQDALVRAYRGAHTFNAGRNLRSWLLSILQNAFVDGTRTRDAEMRRARAMDTLADTETPAPQEHAVRLRQLRQSFLALPEDQRAVLHLVAIEGLSYKDTAETLAIPIGTVISRLSRARATLRELEAETRPRHKLRIVGGRDEPAA